MLYEALAARAVTHETGAIVERQVLHVIQEGRPRADVDRDVSARLLNPIERRAIDDEILHDGKRRRAERLDDERVPFFEAPHA